MPNTRPPDCPPYVERPRVFQVPFVLGDGSNSWGGTPPVYANMPADPVPTLPAGYVIITPDATGTSGYVTQAEGGTEAKLRTHINPSHFGRDDPVRNWGEPDTAHWHQFFGATHVNAFTTYKTLREQLMSNAAGGLANNTSYWSPAWLVNIDGQVYGKEMDYAVVYYSDSMVNAQAHKFVSIPRGLRYVTGVNMDDPDDLQLKADIEASNAAIGQPGRFQYITNGFIGFTMLDSQGALIPTTLGQTYSSWLVNPDGSDPWGGLAGPGSKLGEHINGPGFIDGHNLWSPGGYRHVSHGVRDSYTGEIIGPQGWWKVPHLTLSQWYTHQGWADYSRWYKSSDAHMSALLGRTVNPGESCHSDWLDGWNYDTRLKWERNGLGVDGFEPHEMNDSRISATEVLITGEGSPDGRRNPQLQLGRNRGSTPGNGLVLLSAGAAKGPFATRHRT